MPPAGRGQIPCTPFTYLFVTPSFIQDQAFRRGPGKGYRLSDRPGHRLLPGRITDNALHAVQSSRPESITRSARGFRQTLAGPRRDALPGKKASGEQRSVKLSDVDNLEAPLDVDILGGFEPVNAVSIYLFTLQTHRRPTGSARPLSGVVHLNAWPDAFPVHLSQRFHKQSIQRSVIPASGRRLQTGVQTDKFLFDET